MNECNPGELTWPEGFMDIGGQNFAWVHANRPVWVEFTLEKMDDPSGLFRDWKTYCINKQHAQKSIPSDERQGSGLDNDHEQACKIKEHCGQTAGTGAET